MTWEEYASYLGRADKVTRVAGTPQVTGPGPRR